MQSSQVAQPTSFPTSWGQDGIGQQQQHMPLSQVSQSTPFPLSWEQAQKQQQQTRQRQVSQPTLFPTTWPEEDLQPFQQLPLPFASPVSSNSPAGLTSPSSQNGTHVPVTPPLIPDMDNHLRSTPPLPLSPLPALPDNLPETPRPHPQVNGATPSQQSQGQDPIIAATIRQAQSGIFIFPGRDDL
jgi:hypothetical protein